MKLSLSKPKRSGNQRLFTFSKQSNKQQSSISLVWNLFFLFDSKIVETWDWSCYLVYYPACTITCYILCLLQHSAIDSLQWSKLSAFLVLLLVYSPSAPIPCCITCILSVRVEVDVRDTSLCEIPAKILFCRQNELKL